jgi:uncharacterized protein (TIGR02611 family)
MRASLGRIGRTVLGGLLVVIGIVLIPLPGPGLLVVVAGLIFLARDYEWADRLLVRTRERARQVGHTLRRRAAGESADAHALSPTSSEEEKP